MVEAPGAGGYPGERMFDRVVLGVDPGVATVGLAAVVRGRDGRPRVLFTETVRTRADVPMPARLLQVHRRVRDALAASGAGSLAIERLLWGRNTTSAMEVARASGAVLLAAAEAGVPVEEYAPMEVKMATTGVGNATKAQVRRALGMIVGPAAVPTQPDAADAVAVALCHLTQSPLRRLAGAAR